MIRLAITALSLLVAQQAFAAPVPKELKKEFKIEGTWEMVAIDSYGRKVTVGSGLHWTFDEKGNMRSHHGPIQDPDATSIIQFTFHPEDKTVEYRSTNGQRVCPGVYEFDGDTLRICCNLRQDKRPMAIEVNAATYVWSLMRAKEGK